jgi:Uma2 family endonuclease
MALSQSIEYISEDEYLRGEQESAIRHEYINGIVYAMAGASDKHNTIALNASALLHAGLPEECEVFMSDMKLRMDVQGEIIFYYPDVLVSCAEDDRATYYREQPCLIIEVLSKTTRRQDRHEKFLTYKELPSLQEYLILEQEYRAATLFRRRTGWQPELYQDGDIHLESVNLSMSMGALYRRVRFA